MARRHPSCVVKLMEARRIKGQLLLMCDLMELGDPMELVPVRSCDGRIQRRRALGGPTLPRQIRTNWEEVDLRRMIARISSNPTPIAYRTARRTTDLVIAKPSHSVRLGGIFVLVSLGSPANYEKCELPHTRSRRRDR